MALIPPYEYKPPPAPKQQVIPSELSNVFDILNNKPKSESRAHNHYFKDVSKLKYVDVYRVLELFNVTDPCIQHAVKKLLVAGGRGAGKDINKDIQEAIDSLARWKEMRVEDQYEI